MDAKILLRPVYRPVNRESDGENGKFILRGRKQDDSKLRSRYKRRSLIALASSLFYIIVTRRSITQPAKPHIMSSSASDDDDDADEEVQRDASPERQQQSPTEISLTIKYLEYLQSLDPIPKKVHIFFPDKNYWRMEDPIPFVEHSILSLMKLNPDYNVTIYDDEMVDNVIRKAVHSNLIHIEECNLLVGVKEDEGKVIHQAAHIVERSDIARLILMYTEGGFYTISTQTD